MFGLVKQVPCGKVPKLSAGRAASVSKCASGGFKWRIGQGPSGAPSDKLISLDSLVSTCFNQRFQVSQLTRNKKTQLSHRRHRRHSLRWRQDPRLLRSCCAAGAPAGLPNGKCGGALEGATEGSMAAQPAGSDGAQNSRFFG